MAEVLSFDWDRGNTAHIARHGVTPGDIEELFANDPADIGFETVEGEGRWTSIGHTRTLRILVVVWTMRGEAVRPITAFEPGRRLREAYAISRGL
jgi:uncharacterized DUF497 family protein